MLDNHRYHVSVITNGDLSMNEYDYDIEGLSLGGWLPPAAAALVHNGLVTKREWMKPTERSMSHV